MKSRAFLILSPFFAACTIHVHVHDAPEPVVASAAATSPERRMVKGVVRDSEGSAVEAHVAVVGTAGGGSNTMGTGADGRFEIPAVGSSEFALHASTEDGRVAVTRSETVDKDFELVLRPGAVFVIQFEGRDKARCAVFADGLRIEDFTLREGARAKVVVPPGEQRVRIYDGATVLHERHFTAQAGSTESIRMLAQP